MYRLLIALDVALALLLVVLTWVVLRPAPAGNVPDPEQVAVDPAQIGHTAPTWKIAAPAVIGAFFSRSAPEVVEFEPPTPEVPVIPVAVADLPPAIAPPAALAPPLLPVPESAPWLRPVGTASGESGAVLLVVKDTRSGTVFVARSVTTAGPAGEAEWIVERRSGDGYVLRHGAQRFAVPAP